MPVELFPALWSFSSEPVIPVKNFTDLQRHCFTQSKNFLVFLVFLFNYSKWIALYAGNRTSINFMRSFNKVWLKPQPSRQLLVQINNRNIRTMCKICSMSKIKTPERRQWRGCGVFIFNFEQISHIVLMFPLLNLSNQLLYWFIA